MQSIKRIYFLFAAVLLFMVGCKFPPTKKENGILAGMVTIGDKKLTINQMPIDFSVVAADTPFTMPALHSFAYATYKGLWIFIGGKKNGFHGMGNNPPPFMSTTANDSIWVVDPIAKQSWGVPVPAVYNNYLIASNPAFFQSGNSLYFCGGFTRDNATAPRFNTTSDHFFEFNIANLVQYVQSGGSNPALSQVISKTIVSPYVQTTGSDLIMVNGNFYLIGGQNYSAVYSAGKTGMYTNAVRKFSLQNVSGEWTIADTVSVTDTVNLHRRDMNVVPYFVNGQQTAIIYGGVFTRGGLAYMQPVNITGLQNGQPAVAVDSMRQMVNQYSSAKAILSFGNSSPQITVFFGGISYMRYDTTQAKLVIGDNGIPMPFSNLTSMVFNYDNFSPLEYIQTPPNGSMLPAYLGANACFFPLPKYALSESQGIIDGNKVINDISSGPLLIGYIFGGIISLGPTSGTTVKGYIATYANPVLYKVYLNLNGNNTK